jgi:hypothetical protein
MAKKQLDKEAQFEQERKKWQKQEAKKRAKKKNKVDSTAIVVKVVSVLVAAAVVLGIGAIYLPALGIPMRFFPAVSVGGECVAAPEWAFYFYSQYRNTASQADYYAQMYGSDVMGLDTSKSIWGQKSSQQDDKGNLLNWETVLQQQTNEMLTNLLTLAQEAAKAKVTLDSEDKKEINDQMEEMRVSASSNSMGLGAFLRANYLPGITERRYRSILERETIVGKYEEQKREELRGKYTDALLQEEYDAAPADFNVASLRAFPFAKDVLTAKDGETDEALKVRQDEANAAVKKKANDFLAKLSDEASFLKAADESADKESTPDYDAATATARFRTKKADLQSSYGDAYADWVFDTVRKAGDFAVVESDSSYYVLFLTQTQYAVTTVDYFSFAFDFPANDDGSELTDEQKAQTKELADKMVASWKENGANEDAFVTLVEAKEAEAAVEGESAEEEAAETIAGKTEKAAPGAAEAALENWIFDRGRKALDFAVIETSTGYTVVLFSKNNSGDPVWRTELADTHVNEDYEAYLTEAKKQYPFAEKFGIKSAVKASQKLCDTYAESVASAAASAYTG